MKLTLTSLLALCLCLSGCGKNEKPETQAKGENPLTSVVPKAKEAQSKPKSPEPKIEAKDNSKAKTSQPKQGVELTEEEAFKILVDALSGIAFDERDKALYKIEVDDPRSRHSSFNSVSFVSRVPPGFPSDKLNAGQDLRRIIFRVEGARVERVEGASEAARAKIAEINKRMDKIKDAQEEVRVELRNARLDAAKGQIPEVILLSIPIPIKPAVDQNRTAHEAKPTLSPVPSRGTRSSSRRSSGSRPSSSRYNRRPTTPTRPPSEKTGSLKSIPARGNPPVRPRERTKQDVLISDMYMRSRELSRELSKERYDLEEQTWKTVISPLVMYQEPLQKPEGVAKEEPKPKRWVLGPNIEAIDIGFWHEKAGDFIDYWDEPGFPERIRVEMAFEQADGSPAMIHDMHHCVVFSPEAAKANLKAAEQGDAHARYHLGMMYSNGNQVKEDDKEALKWWRKAAEQGYARAQSQLALAYFKGEGVPKDIVIACAWLHLAELDEGSSPSYGDINISKGRELMRKITSEQLKKGESMAEEWQRENPKLVK